jgi:hypothetical protein
MVFFDSIEFFIIAYALRFVILREVKSDESQLCEWGNSVALPVAAVCKTIKTCCLLVLLKKTSPNSHSLIMHRAPKKTRK